MNKNYRNLLVWLTIGLGLFLFVESLLGQRHAIPYSDFLTELDSGKISSVTIKGSAIEGIYSDGRSFSTNDPQDPDLIRKLIDRKIKINSDPNNNIFLMIFINILPLLLILGLSFFAFRQVQAGGNRALSFGKSKAKLNDQKTKVTFDDVAGVDEAKNEVEEIVDFLKGPHKFKRLGGKIPRGVLLVGPPGTGKTLLARAIAGEAGVPFFSISGSEFVEMFVGVGASRVRDMFEQGKKNAPCIIFIDEIDAVGRHRGFGLGGGSDEREQTLNQLLVEMDGFEENDGVIIISATNRPDVLDPALLRPGRFDRQVVVPSPDVKGREKILQVHLKKVPIAEDVDPMVIARGTPGFSGADLASLVNEAALLAARYGRKTVSMDELDEAKDKVMMGSERRSMVMTENERKLTAYHEAGHAIVALNIPESDPIHKATIIPRGRALGMVMRLPENDRISVSRVKLEADLSVAAGGRIAEEMIFGHDKVTTGASSDIDQATRIAKKMVIEWGMSDKLGFLSYAGEGAQEVFLGHSSSSTAKISSKTAQVIDEEIRTIIDKTYARAKKILEENADALEVLAQGLLEHETLSGEEIQKILEGQKIEKKQRPVIVRPTKRSKMPTSTKNKTTRKKTGDSKSK